MAGRITCEVRKSPLQGEEGAAAWGTIRGRLETNTAGTIPMAAAVGAGLAGAACAGLARHCQQGSQRRREEQEGESPT